MKNEILDNYGLRITNYYKKNKIVYFKYDNNIYLLKPIYDTKSIKLLYEMNILTNNYDEIIRDKYGSIIGTINGEKYILIKKIKKEYDLVEEVRKRVQNPVIISNNMNIRNIEWIKLWSNKIDYYEYYIKHMNKTQIISESIDYFIGMGETAISYLKYNLEPETEMLVLSHKRINKKDYYDPTNLIIDSRARDLAELLKERFFRNEYSINNLENIFKKINLSRNEYILLYSRLIFPSFYFDVYDKVANKQVPESELSKIIQKTTNYESFLEQIYVLISKKNIRIPKVNWI